jgi:hypothetical protein
MPNKRKKKLVTNVATGATQGTQKESYGSRRRRLTRHVSSNLDLDLSPEDQREELNDQLNEKLRNLPDDGETVDDVMRGEIVSLKSEISQLGKRIDADAALQHRVLRIGIVRPVIDDGNCFQRSIADAVSAAIGEAPKAHGDVRKGFRLVLE